MVLGRDVALFTSWTIELLMLFYRVWRRFCLLCFTGLPTVNQDTIESAVIDGASRFGVCVL